MSRKLKPLKFVRQREEGKKAKWAMDGTNDGSEGSLSLSPERQQGEFQISGGLILERGRQLPTKRDQDLQVSILE